MQFQTARIQLGLVVLFSLFSSAMGLAEPVTAPHVEVQLVAAQESFQWGKPMRVAIRWEIENGWHLYWRNPGDSGEAPKISWKLPDGFAVTKTFWPTPRPIAVPPLRNYGFEKELLLVTEIQPPASGSALGSAPISAEASWLVCQESCIPGSATLNLELPANEAAPQPSQYAEAFSAVQAQWPSPQSPWQFAVKIEDDFVHLEGKGPVQFEDAYFFANDRVLFRHAEDQPFEKTDDGWRLKLPKKNTFPAKLDRLAGVLVVEGKQREAFEIDVPVAATAAGVSQSLYAILAAFLGGLILNLMPCVFPILCLKVLSFASLGGSTRKKALLSSAAYSGGILVSFWALAGTLMVLRAGGEQLGWGFQLQSPYFLIGLVVLLLAMSLNFFGTFEVGGSWTGVGQGLASQEGNVGSFFSGVLATLVATPCTAPFMGTAVGFAFTQPPYMTLLIFTSLALGLAAPYVVLALSPSLVKLLPRPGQWMVTLKQGMGFLLLLTVLWLVSVLALQVQLASLFHVLLALLGISFGLWLWGLGGKKKRVIAVLFIAASSYWALTRGVHRESRMEASEHERWEKYTEEAVDKAVHEGQAVFIDFTAAWCITCQVNEQVALEVDSVKKKFEDKKVRLFKADWTNQDAQIAKKLESYGRQGVPLYVFYPGANQAPRILPQILTPQIVLDELDKSTAPLPSTD
jgi:thiol:disulfide interchange protein